MAEATTQSDDTAARKRRMTGERNRFLSFAFAAADLLLEVDKSGRIAFAAGAARDLVGLPTDALLEIPLADLVAQRDKRIVAGMIDALGHAARLQPTPITLADDTTRALIGACRLADAGQNLSFTLSRFAGQTVVPAADAVRDPATGALARDEFAAYASALIAGDALPPGSQLSFVELTGLDDLRKRLGGGEIERFLGEVADHLRAQSVGGDAVGRLDGSRFGVVQAAGQGAGGLADGLARMAEVEDPTGSIAVHRRDVAIDAVGLDERDISNVVGFTIRSFLESEGGSFRLESLAASFREMARDLADRATCFKQIIAFGDFDLVYQPIVALKNEHLHHYEVLSRFQNGTSPFEMLTLAEKVGLIEEFDLAVFARVVETMQREVAAGRPVELAVNLSGCSIQRDGVVDAIREMLRPLGALRRHFLIEVTETTALTDLERVENVLQGLRSDGMPVCLDDFGAGAASFSYAQALTVDYIKVDGGYVRNMMVNPRDVAILRAMVGLCRDLSVATVAERVETRDQAESLKRLGIGFGQGWLFGKPGGLPEPVAATAIVPSRLPLRRAARAR